MLIRTLLALSVLAFLNTACGRNAASSTTSRGLNNLGASDTDGVGCVDTSDADSKTKQLREAICNLANRERAKAGVSPLNLQSARSEVAQAHALDMYLNTFFSHTSPTTGSFTKRLRSAGIKYSAAAENIARNSSSDPAKIIAQWMSSSGHRKNLLSPSYRKLGVGIDEGNWVQVFTN